MLNEVRLIGRLGKDPKIKSTANGRKVASLNVATWESYYNEKKWEWETLTEWHDVVSWLDQKDTRMEKLKKGDLVLVSGKLQTRKWTDSQNNTRYTTEVVGTVKGIRTGSSSGQGEAQPGKAGADDDLPF